MAAENKIDLKDQIKVLPQTPGVYQFYSIDQKILYVGKAINLKKRVSSYFKNQFDNRKTRLLSSKIHSIKTISLNTEMDAFLLENSLIKKHQPKYNIQLKDDKTYPWICIKKELYPRVFYTRKKENNGAKYFGPYSSVKLVNSLIEMIKENFEIRSCDHILSEEKLGSDEFQTAVDFYIGNCKGCCQGKVSIEKYNKRLLQVKQVLNGNTYEVIKQFKSKMLSLSETYQYEEANAIKKKIQNLKNFQAKTAVVDTNIHGFGVLNIDDGITHSFVNCLKVMNGSIVQSKTVQIKKKFDEDSVTILSFVVADNLAEFFSEVHSLILPQKLSLSTGHNEYVPSRGDKKKLLMISKKNAMVKRQGFEKLEIIKNPELTSLRLLTTIKNDLRLKELPHHMECFDNSNIQGEFPVAACVVFKDAKPNKKEYRHFNIKTVEGPDDFASMEEVVFRRYKRLSEENKQLPQLIIIDGGKGQLSSALKSLKKLDIHNEVAIIGIAKKLEEIYYPGDMYPLYLDKKSETLKVIQLMRNEAHRFGITHHRNKRSKSLIKSELQQIVGLGPKSIDLLLKKHKSVNNIKKLNKEDLSILIGNHKADLIIKYFLT
ncbi:MAG: excinuclease ABC subunit UvrC [Flavobacteriales bacterium]|nr:excinuclease ABC subunit UvrC [Flavobacteriales bacterium]